MKENPLLTGRRKKEEEEEGRKKKEKKRTEQEKKIQSRDSNDVNEWRMN